MKEDPAGSANCSPSNRRAPDRTAPGGAAKLRRRRWLGGAGVVMALPLCLTGASAVWLSGSLPRTEGRVEVSGIAREARISRDTFGIPTIRASSETDAAFALGYVHAQDRLFQMELLRRAGAGRLAEILGEAALPSDKFMRGLGLHRLAEKQWDLLAPEVKATVSAYAAGVNAFINGRGNVLPPEYHLLGFTPEAWKPADSLVWGKLMALQLSGNFRGALLRARLARRLSTDEMGKLFPDYPTDAPRTIAALLPEDDVLARIVAGLPDLAGPVGASNNWVIDGRHTESGKPLLANDPHLPLAAPGQWYLARIEAPGLTLTGATAPGIPFLIIGHNKHAGWGFTTTESDVEDLFIERVDPADHNRYLAPGGSRPFLLREEEIAVRGSEPVRITIRATRHGPVISDLHGAAAAEGADQLLALSAPFLAEDDRSPEALWRMNRAMSWDAFNDALRNFTAPQQNIVYADTAGTIGFVAPARVPIRARGNGSIPVPGWSGDYDWTGFVPFEHLPRSVNPGSGRFVSANNKIVPDDYPYFLGGDWDIPNRAERIGTLIDADPVQSPDKTAAIQADSVSLAARRLLPLLLRVPPADARSAEAVRMLRGWDGTMAPERAEPLIFTAWLRELNRALLAPKLGDTFDAYWGLRPRVIENILTGDAAWCGGKEACDRRITEALQAALAGIERELGGEMAEWRWDALHVALFPHPVLSRLPVVGRFLAVRIPAGGGEDTVNRGAMAIADREHPFADVHAAGLRMILDFADLDASRFMVTPGQSGNPLSPHYADLLRPWRDFAWLYPGRGASVATLVLTTPPMP